MSGRECRIKGEYGKVPSIYRWIRCYTCSEINDDEF